MNNPYLQRDATEAPRRAEWMTQGLCTRENPEAFFPTHRSDPSYAKSICRQCPVQVACIDFALETERAEGTHLWGIWGGATEHERRRLHKKARRAS